MELIVSNSTLINDLVQYDILDSIKHHLDIICIRSTRDMGINMLSWILILLQEFVFDEGHSVVIIIASSVIIKGNLQINLFDFFLRRDLSCSRRESLKYQ